MRLLTESVFPLCLAAFAMFAACDDDRPSDNTAQRVPLQLNVTKLGDTRLDGTQWEEGDQIGVFLQAYDASLGNGSPYVEGVVNVPFAVNPSDGSCTPVNAESAIFLEKGQTYAVLAYYPYTADLSLDTDENAAVYAIDSWTRQSNQSKLDLLIARTYGVTADESSVSLTLERAASRLQLNISPSSGMSADAMSNVSAWVSGLNHYTDWDMRGRFISHQGLVSDSIPFKMTLDDGKVTGVAIVPPSDGTSITGISISIALSDTDIRTIAIDDETRFVAGKSYIWNVSLSPELNVDDVVDEILGMTESGTVNIAGYLPDGTSAFPRINGALKTLFENNSDIEVTLDMSNVTGLTELPDASDDEPQSFNGCYNLVGITLPLSLKRIGNNSFYCCANLVTVGLPDGLESIGRCAFYYGGMSSIVVPNSVTSIGEQAFCGCSLLESATLGTGLTSIGRQMFQGCNSLETVNVHGEITSIGEQAFFNCSVMEQFTIPSTVTSIGDGAFKQCSNLLSIEVPAGVTDIGQETFYSCKKLASVTLHEGLESIGYQAFCMCNKLEEVELPSTLDSIATYAFYISGLKSVDVPNNITKIDDCVFAGCTSLASVTLRGGVTTLGNLAFAACGFTEFEIPTSVTYFGESVFKSCVNLEQITIPTTMDSITMRMFEDCTSLTTVTLHDGLKRIGYQAFSGCESLAAIDFPDAVEWIGDESFYGCGFTEIDVPAGISKIGSSMFASCANLKTVTLHEGLDSIGGQAFTECAVLETINMPTTLRYIGQYAFEDCTSLPSIDIPANVDCVDERAFYGCSSLTTVNLVEGSLDSIGAHAFAGSGLQTLTVPSCVTRIGMSAFSCESLTSLSVNMVNIPAYAFSGCLELTSITLGNKVETIGSYAFADSYALPEITIPANVKTIGKRAFSECYVLQSATFEVTSGWSAGSTALSETRLSNTATAAQYLTEDYVGSEWTRE